MPPPLLRQTFPALFNLFKEGHLPKDLQIIGYARTSECWRR